MAKRYPIKFSDLLSSDERISLENGVIKNRLRWYVQLTQGTALSAKRCRYLAAWLLDAADYIDKKEGKVI